MGLPRVNFGENATKANDLMRLTPVGFEQHGAAWHAVKQNVQDGFDTPFQFQLTDLRPSGADGPVEGDVKIACRGTGRGKLRYQLSCSRRIGDYFGRISGDESADRGEGNVRNIS